MAETLLPSGPRIQKLGNTLMLIVNVLSSTIWKTGFVLASKSDLISETVSASNSTNLAANAAFEVSIPVSKSGYTIMGVVEWSMENRTAINVTGVRVDGNNVKLLGVNSTQQVVTVTPRVRVLYFKS